MPLTSTQPIANPILQGPSGPVGPNSPTSPTPTPRPPTPGGISPLTPQQAAGAASTYYGPTQNYYNGQIQGVIAGQALNGQQLADQVNYANAQYGTGQQNIGLDRQSIDAQRIGLAGDNRYLSDILGITQGANTLDRRYATRDDSIAQQLFNVLIGQNQQQSRLHGQQLAAQLAQLGFQSSQARGVAANDTQQLGEQVGAMGAFGSRGAGERQGFIGSTLANTLGGYREQGNLDRVARDLAQSQLVQSGAGYRSNLANTRNTNQRRIGMANNSDRRAYADYAHGRSGTQLSKNQLDIAAARLGVSSQSLYNTLQNAINSANLGYGQGTLSANQALNQGYYNQATLNQNRSGLAFQLGAAG